MIHDIDKKLNKLKIPLIILKHHKKRLATLLFSSHEKPSFFWNRKAAIAFGLPILIIGILLGQSNLFKSPTVTAQEIIKDTLHTIENTSSDQQPSQQLTLLLQILNEAQQSQELEYIGDEYKYGSSGKLEKVYKLVFKDENIIDDIIIRITQNAPPENMVQLHFVSNFPTTSKIEIPLVNNTIRDPEQLRKDLEDPYIAQDWVRDFIHQYNTIALDKLLVKAKEKSPEHQAMLNILSPYILNAEVLILGGAVDNDQKSYVLYTYPLTRQKSISPTTVATVKKAIEKLQAFNTESANMKIKALERALQSEQLKAFNAFTQEERDAMISSNAALRYYEPNQQDTNYESFFFVDDISGEIIHFWLDFTKDSEDFFFMEHNYGIVPLKSTPSSKTAVLDLSPESLQAPVSLEQKQVDASQCLQGALIAPMNGNITQYFNFPEHMGIDIINTIGTPVQAVADGKVENVISSCGANDPTCGDKQGNQVRLIHGNDTRSVYTHLDSVNVEVGQSVKQGDVIGTVGRTGKLFGKSLHLGVLHFELYLCNIPVDPFDYFKV